MDNWSQVRQRNFIKNLISEEYSLGRGQNFKTNKWFRRELNIFKKKLCGLFVLGSVIVMTSLWWPL